MPSINLVAKSLSDDIYRAMDIVKEVLVESGISCFKMENYEARDLILACLDRAKEDYPDLPIDIISNDENILPLVDEQVSVFLRSMETL